MLCFYSVTVNSVKLSKKTKALRGKKCSFHLQEEKLSGKSKSCLTKCSHAKCNRGHYGRVVRDGCWVGCVTIREKSNFILGCKKNINNFKMAINDDFLCNHI